MKNSQQFTILLDYFVITHKVIFNCWKDAAYSRREVATPCRMPPLWLILLQGNVFLNHWKPLWMVHLNIWNFMFIAWNKGRVAVLNWMNFWKSSKGGGSFSIQKFILQILGTLNKTFWSWNWYKIVISEFRYVFKALVVISV